MLVKKNIFGFKILSREVTDSLASYLEMFLYLTERIIDEQGGGVLTQGSYDNYVGSRVTTLNLENFVMEQAYSEDEIAEAYRERLARHLGMSKDDKEFKTILADEWGRFKSRFVNGLPSITFRLVDLNNVIYSFITVDVK